MNKVSNSTQFLSTCEMSIGSAFVKYFSLNSLSSARALRTAVRWAKLSEICVCAIVGDYSYKG